MGRLLWRQASVCQNVSPGSASDCAVWPSCLFREFTRITDRLKRRSIHRGRASEVLGWPDPGGAALDAAQALRVELCRPPENSGGLLGLSRPIDRPSL